MFILKHAKKVVRPTIMIMPSDKDYKETKHIKKGNQKINPDFAGLADWINITFNVSVINIFYDTIYNKEKRPRLSIIFEYHKDELQFRDGQSGNFDNEKQKVITDKFRELVNGKTKKPSLFDKLLSRASDLKYNSDNLLVIFTSFEPIAKDEANSTIPESEVTKLKTELELNDLWKIYRQFSGTTFFFYTDKQVDEYSKNGIKENLSKKYLTLLKNYDEFKYFKEDTFSIMLDSKENFDNNYESNWFYYSR